MQWTTNLARVAIVGAIAATLAAQTHPAAAVTERRTGAAQRQALSVIVYGDFALVRDVRRLNVDRGRNRVAFDDVAPRMEPETAFLTDLTAGAPIWVHEHNFETDVLSPDTVFARAVGHKVLVIRYDQMTGRETRETAVVLSTNGPILQFKDRVETGLPPSSRVAYFSVPPMRRVPGFVIDFDSPSAAAHSVALAYLTGGLSWSTDYIARLNGSDDHLDIDAFITLHNESGVSFDNASVRVVAGNVQRSMVTRSVTADTYTVNAAASTTSNVYAASPSRATREPISEFYQYSLPQHTTLGVGETKQSLLLFARDVPVRQIFQTSTGGGFESEDGSDQQPPVDVSLQFENDGHGLGVPLPSGVIHMYQNDQSGEPVFIGEDSIGNVPRKDTIRLSLGQSFEVTVHRIQTEFHEIPHLKAATEFVSAYRITVKNAKARAVALRYVEQLDGQWQITSESMPHQKQSSTIVAWTIPVAAGGQTVLTFQVDTH
jgi:hypothetical protein